LLVYLQVSYLYRCVSYCLTLVLWCSGVCQSRGAVRPGHKDGQCHWAHGFAVLLWWWRSGWSVCSC